MFTVNCSYRTTMSGLVFLPAGKAANDEDYLCDLRVEFQPTAYYPPEPDVGAGDDFEAEIVSIEMRDWHDGNDEQGWHKLTGADLAAAKAMLEQHHSREMWDQAGQEAFEQLGSYRRAA